MKSVRFITLGCKVNTYETEALIKLFIKNNYQVTNNDIADIYVINTCTVTNQSDSKSRKEIRKAIRYNPQAIVCVTGCYAQTKPKEVLDIDGVDIVIGTSNRNKIIDLIKQYEQEKEPINIVENIMKVDQFENLTTSNMQTRTRAFLKIQEGCNNFCSFCIIPWARGLLRSKKPEELIKQIQNFVDNGFKEVVLTGIHTAGYGLDFEDFDFGDLLIKIGKEVKGLDRLRISSIEASQVTNKVLDAFKKYKFLFTDHLHIPLQSGSDNILKLMRRNYDLAGFEKNINKIKEIFPNISITTDIIVGFPNESDQDFQNTLNFVKKINFSEIHVFPYSIRNGTPAAKMKNHVDPQTKKQRVKELINLSNENAKKYAKEFENKELEVLFENKKDGIWSGWTRNYIKVHVKSNQNLENQVKKVKITKANYPFSNGVLL